MPVFLGLDCGGSSCRALAVDHNGEVVHQGQSGPANLASTYPHKIREHLCQAVKGCPEPDAVAACFAGLLIDEDRKRAEGLLKGLFPAAKLQAQPDYFAALWVCPDPSICVIAGTGSLVASRNQGRVVKSGGGGYLIGDPGSTFQYGRDALRHFLAHGPDGVSEKLRTTVEGRFGLWEGENVLLAKLYRGATPVAAVAKLASALAADAKAGETYAVDSVRCHSKELAAVVATHIERQFADAKSVGIHLAGGLWEASGLFKAKLEEDLRAELPGITLEIQRIGKAPVHGAVELAKEMLR
jgi:glucosamine kinase